MVFVHCPSIFKKGLTITSQRLYSCYWQDWNNPFTFSCKGSKNHFCVEVFVHDRLLTRKKSRKVRDRMRKFRVRSGASPVCSFSPRSSEGNTHPHLNIATSVWADCLGHLSGAAVCFQYWHSNTSPASEHNRQMRMMVTWWSFDRGGGGPSWVSRTSL